MKNITHKRVRFMLMLLKRKHAHFFIDNGLNYTYPKGGWVEPAVIDGEVLEYVPKHDNGNNVPDVEYKGVPSSSKIVLGKMRN